MNIHEYQAKQLLARYDVPVPRGGVAFSAEEAAKVADQRPGRDRIVALPRDPENRFPAFADALPDGAVDPVYVDTHAEELSLLLYTSGSTGAPKGACHCHRDMLAIADTYWRYSIAPGPAAFCPLKSWQAMQLNPVAPISSCPASLTSSSFSRQPRPVARHSHMPMTQSM